MHHQEATSQQDLEDTMHGTSYTVLDYLARQQISSRRIDTTAPGLRRTGRHRTALRLRRLADALDR